MGDVGGEGPGTPQLDRHGGGQVPEVAGSSHALGDEAALEVVAVGVRGGGLGNCGGELVDRVHGATIRMTAGRRKCKIRTVKAYGEYCPIAMGAGPSATDGRPSCSAS